MNPLGWEGAVLNPRAILRVNREVYCPRSQPAAVRLFTGVLVLAVSRPPNSARLGHSSINFLLATFLRGLAGASISDRHNRQKEQKQSYPNTVASTHRKFRAPKWGTPELAHALNIDAR